MITFETMGFAWEKELEKDLTQKFVYAWSQIKLMDHKKSLLAR
jgi:hypothetical protein